MGLFLSTKTIIMIQFLVYQDESKFRKISEDPTHTRLKTVQTYLRKLLERKEITEEVFKKTRPQHAKIARAHGLPKVHKSFDILPKFRPIIGTTGSTHHNIGQYFTKLLCPLTQNNYTLKDSFDAAERIRSIQSNLLDNDEYTFISLDVVSLFTNVPL